jgi:hypothetical protein
MILVNDKVSTNRERVPPPLRSSKRAVDINGFFEIVGKAFDHYIQTEGAPDATSPIFIERFPQERLGKPDKPFEVITFSVLEGALSPVLNDGRTNRNPSIREVRVDKTKEGYNKITYGWWESYTVKFEIWSKSNPTANKLVVWFNKFLKRYDYFYNYFAAYGIQKFKFEKRLEDVTETKEDQEIYKRCLCYSFRLEMLDTFIEHQLTSLTIGAGFPEGGEIQKVELCNYSDT